MRFRASLIAFITAGIAPKVPASPTPLTPSGLLGLGQQAAAIVYKGGLA